MPILGNVDQLPFCPDFPIVDIPEQAVSNIVAQLQDFDALHAFHQAAEAQNAAYRAGHEALWNASVRVFDEELAYATDNGSMVLEAIAACVRARPVPSLTLGSRLHAAALPQSNAEYYSGLF